MMTIISVTNLYDDDNNINQSEGEYTDDNFDSVTKGQERQRSKKEFCSKNCFSIRD